MSVYGWTFLLVFFLAMSGLQPARAGIYERDYAYRIDKTVGALISMQNKDGGFPAGGGEESDISATSFALLALAGIVREGGIDGETKEAFVRARDYVDRVKPDSFSLPTLDLARYLLVLGAYGDKDLETDVRLLQQRLDAKGHYGRVGEERLVHAQVWSMLALKQHLRPIPDHAVAWLLAAQNEDGGFSWILGGKSDPDSTGAALGALGLSGVQAQHPQIKRALVYLAGMQKENGGFATLGMEENTASDAWVIMGLSALGIDVRKDNRFWVGDRHPLTHMLSLQSTRGWFYWQKDDDAARVLMSAYAILALQGDSFGVPLTNKALQSVALYGDGVRIPSDVPPFLDEGRVLVPLSLVARYWGANVAWMAAEKKVEVVYQGKKTVLLIDEPLGSLGSARIVDGRTLVPLRYLAVRFGQEVHYTPSSWEKRVEITSSVPVENKKYCG